MKRPDMAIPEHPGEMFSWFRDHGVAMVSDFPRLPRVTGQPPVWGTCGPVVGQVWSDACDLGFMIKSQRTGRSVLFLLENDERSEDGVVAWNYRSEDGAVTVRIYND